MIMKPFKVILLLLAVILAFASCGTIKKRYMHKQELRTELRKYSDVLDLARTEIDIRGSGYYFFSSAMPVLNLYLYLKPGLNNYETVTGIRDGLVVFFNNNTWKTRGKKGYPEYIRVTFMANENGGAQLLYELATRGIELAKIYIPNFSGYEWIGRWGGDSHGGKWDTPMRRAVHDDELDVLLAAYSGSLGIEQSECYHSGTGYVKMVLTIRYDYDSEAVLAMRNGLVEFFRDRYNELAKEYGRFDMIEVIFQAREDDSFKWIYTMFYENDEWKSFGQVDYFAAG